MLGPTCKRMNDLRPNSIFLSSAFEPTEEELDAFTRDEKTRSRGRSLNGRQRNKVQVEEEEESSASEVDRKPKAKVGKKSVMDMCLSDLSDSDEDMPDISEIIKRVDEKKQAKSKYQAYSSWELRGLMGMTVQRS